MSVGNRQLTASTQAYQTLPPGQPDGCFERQEEAASRGRPIHNDLWGFSKWALKAGFGLSDMMSGKTVQLYRHGGFIVSAYQLFKLQGGPKHEPSPGVERREHDRWNVSGIATAFCIAGEHFGEMYELHMLDYSDQGLGATCDAAIPPGSVISIGFEAPGYLAKRGEVLHAQPCGHGYRLAIRFDSLAAA